MNKLILTLLLVPVFSYISAQTDMRDGRHIFNYDVFITQCSFDGTPITGATPEKIEANTIFSIRNKSGSDFIIQVSKFTSKSNTAQALNLKFNKTNVGNDIFFKLSQAEYDLNAERLTKRGNFTVGAATTLIKVRPGKKDPKNGYTIYSEFGSDFNIGVSAGWKVQPNRRASVTHSIVGGLSFSSIKITPYTTKKFSDSEATQGCITLSAGYVLEYNKFQVSIFSGLDIMSGEVGRNWIYKNRPWLGLGFGFQIYRAEGEATNK